MLDGDRNAPVGSGWSRRLARLRPSQSRIRTKLAMMLLIPVIALAGIASVRLSDSAQEASDADDTAALVELAGTVSRVIRAMQDERAQAAVQVFKDELDLADTSITGFDNAVTASNERLAELATAREAFAGDVEVTDLLASADKPLSRLTVVRSAAHRDIAGYHLTVYGAAVSRLSRLLDHAVDQAEATSLNRSLRAAVLLSAADESSEQLRVLSLELKDGEPLDAAYRPFMELIGDRQRTLNEYRRISDGTGFDAGGLGAQDARPVNSFEREVTTSRSYEDIAVDHTALVAGFDARHTATGAVIDQTLNDTVAESIAIQETVTRQVLIEVTVVVITIIMAVLTALWLGRSVTRGLRRLRDSARRVARDELPTAVRQVDEQKDLTGLTPEEFADATTPPLGESGDDELSEVAGAFNLVHREAIRVAAQQAMLRVHVGSMFIRLARRGHSLTGRLTAELDAAEHAENDPDQLERLFRLDHLVSLQGRANDSLLVLGGASAAKVRTSNELLGDVLRAAQSHTEHYKRVEFTTVDDGVWIKPAAVDDAVQLLAELIDNATKYSSDPAHVAARFLTDKVVVEIRDHGIGIDEERLGTFNARLGAASPMDLESLQAMGLTVVGILATRIGISVRLRPAPDRGTIAEVVLPATLLDFSPTPEARRRLELTSGAAPQRREAPLFRSRASRSAAAAASGGRTSSVVIDAEDEEIPVVHFAWQAAQVAEQAEPDLDENGLPRRRPMSSLAPGATAPAAARPVVKGPIRRDPAAISATYLAYARGLSGSRQAQKKPNNNPRTPT
ncbi:ATP-binding protein [Phytomonospora sp. NPDC050363]|uniref:ATP-binding protein n=1 Tax=Phytomonospora sp. NPDC050363 TaxID=3155642 RepID=UPI0033CF3702